MGVGREDRLFPAMQRLLANAGLPPQDVGGIVCGEGPGSFTSLRIAASLAKGLAHGIGCALYAVPSLLVAAASAEAALPAGRYLVHAEALRGERYVLPIERDDQGRSTAVGPLSRLTHEQLSIRAAAAQRIAVGTSPLADDTILVSPTIAALSLVNPSWASAPVSLDQWEPVYGRLAEAQVKWEESHGVALPSQPAGHA